MNINYTKCSNCSKILDPDTEAVEHDGKVYCFDCYEDLIADEQDEELD